jgi:hypothetical protein
VALALDVLAFYGGGTGEREKDETWNSTFTALDDKDGRCSIDWKAAAFLVGQDTTTQLSNNCGSAGD